MAKLPKPVPAKLRPKPKPAKAAPRSKTVPLRLAAHKARYIKRLNDLHVGTQTTVAALIAHRDQLNSVNKAGDFHHFVVPSGGSRPEARIKRNKGQMSALLTRMASEEEYGKALMLAVSITEDYLTNMLKLLLRAYPDRLKRGLKNGPSDSEIRLEELLRKTKDEILEDWLRARLLTAIYASPAAYLAYLKAILEIDVDQATMLGFIEAKATRDVLVHSQGIADKRYREKAGDRARAKSGDALLIDHDCTEQSGWRYAGADWPAAAGAERTVRYGQSGPPRSTARDGGGHRHGHCPDPFGSRQDQLHLQPGHLPG